MREGEARREREREREREIVSFKSSHHQNSLEPSQRGRAIVGHHQASRFNDNERKMKKNVEDENKKGFDPSIGLGKNARCETFSLKANSSSSSVFTKLLDLMKFTVKNF